MQRSPKQRVGTPGISGLSAAELLSFVADLQQQLVVQEAEHDQALAQRDQTIKQRENYIQLLEELLRLKQVQKFAARSRLTNTTSSMKSSWKPRSRPYAISFQMMSTKIILALRANAATVASLIRCCVSASN
jgi:hypothetical protein